MKVAVVGHCEYVEFVDVASVPAVGEIVHGTQRFAVAAGGGAVAAVAMARFGAQSLFYTSFGGDELGRRAHDELRARGVTMRAVVRAEPQRRAITLVDANRERTILVIGSRHVAHGADPLPWAELATCDAVYITGGDADAVRAARAARVVVASSRILPLLREAAIDLDALVGSANDACEAYAPGDLSPAPHLVVRTDGANGGRYVVGGVEHAYSAVAAASHGDSYGAGDTFAAALTFALGEGRDPADAMSFAAARAAEVIAVRGPYP